MNRRRHKVSEQWLANAKDNIEVSRVAKQETGFLAVRTGRALRQIQQRNIFSREGFKHFGEWVHSNCGFLGNQASRYMKVGETFRSSDVKGRKLSFSAVHYIATQRQELHQLMLESGSGHTKKSLELAIAAIGSEAVDEEAQARLRELLLQSAAVIEKAAPKDAMQKFLVLQFNQRLKRSLKSVMASCDLGITFFKEEYEMGHEKLRGLLASAKEAQVKLQALRELMEGALNKNYASHIIN